MANSPKARPNQSNEAGVGRAPLKGRTRRCIVSGETLPEAQLIRFALAPEGVAPDGAVVVDVAAKLPGRGVWVRADRASVDAAVKRNAFARAFKAQAKADPDLAAHTEAALAARCLSHLGLMRRSGVLAVGQAQVEGAIRGGKAVALVEALDGNAAERDRLARLFVGLFYRPAPGVGCFSGAELGMALGRERVVHACLLQERSARAWAVEIDRLSGFRPVLPTSWPNAWCSLSWSVLERSPGLGLVDAHAAGAGMGGAPEAAPLGETVLDGEKI